MAIFSTSPATHPSIRTSTEWPLLQLLTLTTTSTITSNLTELGTAQPQPVIMILSVCLFFSTSSVNIIFVWNLYGLQNKFYEPTDISGFRWSFVRTKKDRIMFTRVCIPWYTIIKNSNDGSRILEQEIEREKNEENMRKVILDILFIWCDEQLLK